MHNLFSFSFVLFFSVARVYFLNIVGARTVLQCSAALFITYFPFPFFFSVGSVPFLVGGLFYSVQQHECFNIICGIEDKFLLYLPWKIDLHFCAVGFSVTQGASPNIFIGGRGAV